MASQEDLFGMAHLMRRAGFGADRKELEKRIAVGYEATVEELINPEDYPQIDEDIMYRFMPGFDGATLVVNNGAAWMYRMVNSPRPLEEKMSLFLHQLFATSTSKVDNAPELSAQFKMFRQYGFGTFHNLLVELAKNPAMIFWLDNSGNHNGAINENWGRELLELFSLGVGNYTEEDIKEASRAFTGWTVPVKIPQQPLGRFYWSFEFRPEDHDDGEKTFLGETGRFNGEDIIGIIVKQPAAARFLARHLYNFFVADEVQVPAWNITPPKDPVAIEALVQEYNRTDGDIRCMLRVLFNSEFFKNARFARVKSPAELVAGTVRMVGNYSGPGPEYTKLAMECNYQGQELLNPPSVESWHTGSEWIDGGRLVSRVNFSARLLGDTTLPGVQSMVQYIRAQGSQSPEQIVGQCLDVTGPLEVCELTYNELLGQAQEGGEFRWDTEEDCEVSAKRIGLLLALIGASRDYQFA